MNSAVAVSISNQLYHSDFSSFSLAVQRLRIALQLEMRSDHLPSAEEYWGKQIAECDRATEIFRSHRKHDAINQMHKEGLGQFADALEYNDCSFLAF